MSTIELQGVSLTYRLRRATRGEKPRQGKAGGRLRVEDGWLVVRALQEIDLCIRPGERVGLLGHNGAGKSSLLRVMAGIYRPQAGRVAVQGQVSCLFDKMLGIDKQSSARENILIKGALMGLDRAQVEARIDDILGIAQLGDYADVEARYYASGMAARLGFAIATAFPCDVLLVDEWLGVGDKAFRDVARRRMKDLVDASGTVVFASHNLAALRQNCDRIIQLDHGRVRYDGPLVANLDRLDGADDDEDGDDEE